MRKLCFLSAFLFFSLILVFAWSMKPASELENNIVRLHIIGASNSDNDVRLKLLIRDEIRKNAIHTGKLPTTASIERTANSILQKENAGYGARANLGKFFITRRDYGKFTLPCGKYTAARIELGAAKGDNWWCILSPPLCFTASCFDDTEKLSDRLSDKTTDILYDEMNIKFKTIEVFSRISEFLNKI